MRAVGAILVWAVLATGALAQTIPTYDPAPAGLSVPEPTLVAVEAVRGNVAAWRDAERTRMGAYSSVYRGNGQAPRVENAMPAVGGFFAVFGENGAPSGIVHARWFDAASAVGANAAVRQANLASPYTICGGVLASVRLDLKTATYLGAAWRDEFVALDTELAAPEARIVTGRTYPEGAPPIAFASHPTANDFARYYPQRALEREHEGRAQLSCLVLADQRLTCGVVSEDPPGWAFGSAARSIMEGPSVRVSANAPDGQPSAGFCVSRGVRFLLPD